MIKIKTTEEFDKWLRRLKDRQAMYRITARLDRLKQGHFGDTKSIGNGISEMRIHHGAGYRLYYTKWDKEIVLLLCGGDKDTQQKDIRQAQVLAKQWSDKNHD